MKTTKLIIVALFAILASCSEPKKQEQPVDSTFVNPVVTDSLQADTIH